MSKNKASTARWKARSAPPHGSAFSDSDIAAWADRHNIQGSPSQLRHAFEDARTLGMDWTKTPPALPLAPTCRL